jgi:hypothetical protein
MTRRHVSRVALVLLLAVVAFASAAVRGSDEAGLVVHEWGTFTSIAGENGEAVQWLPLDGPSDLPCFVERFGRTKASLAARIRMETPVLYFYAPSETNVDVTVRFKQGLITEWFPHAAVRPNAAGSSPESIAFNRPGFSSVATWQHVTVGRHATSPLPDDRLDSHYYVARRTDASPVTIDGVSEKFLFYRGIGAFEPPISALIRDDGRVDISSATGVGDVVLFENHGGAISYRVVHSPSTHLTLNPPALDGESATPQDELEKVLIAHGLYPAEAKAMVQTWRDSWFEEGSRLFYVVPRRAIDEFLPIDISPAPSSLVRVFVGRVELVTAATRHEVAAAFASNDRQTLRQYARFLPAIAARLATPATQAERARRRSAIEEAAVPSASRVCR